MSEPHFKRFSAFHRVLHWLIAVPYIALMATGAIILLHRLGWMDVPSVKVSVTLHRWVGLAFTGIVLELLLAAFAGGHWRSVGRDFYAWLSFRPSDLLWLSCIPLNACFPKRFALPAADRFNAGQKLHGLFILVAVTGFIATGLVMILIPGWLTVWRIHVVLFFAAIGFLALHLFLGLINPPTRRALSGIFTGNVSRAYMREHHALVLNEVDHEQTPHAAVSLTSMVLAVLVLAVPLFLWWRGPGHTVVPSTMAGPWRKTMFSPGALAMAHSSVIRADNCVACHAHSGPVTNTSCLACHAEISKALEQKVGYHGSFTADCVTCHTEHHGAGADLRNFNTHSFNHDLAQFTLNGVHRSTGCDACHIQHSPTLGQMRYIGVQFSACTDCHANPHADLPAADCRRCHSEQGWTGRNLLFVHNRDSSFKLDAIHSTLSCVSCHKQVGTVAVFRGTPTSCAQCHKQTADAMAGRIGQLVLKADPHDGRVSCVDCHTPGIRSQTPAQYATECARCHGDQYRTLFFNWQKSIDEHEQAARLRLRQLAGADLQTMQRWSALLDHAHAAGIHNVQGTSDAFEKVGR